MNKTLMVTMLTAGLALAGCGGGSDGTSSAIDEGADVSAQVGETGTGRGAGGAPQGSGEVVQVSDSTAQVQNQAGQIAVTWTNATTFTQQVETDLSAVAVGACVVVISDSTTSEDVVATGVRVSEAGDDGCGPEAGRGAGRGDASRTPPADRPEGAPEGRQGAGAGRGTVGEVLSVQADGFTVGVQGIEGDGTTAVEVTVSTDTELTTSGKATASDITVGRCIISGGAADDTGAITAETISISDPVDGECASGQGSQRRQVAG